MQGRFVRQSQCFRRNLCESMQIKEDECELARLRGEVKGNSGELKGISCIFAESLGNLGNIWGHPIISI